SEVRARSVGKLMLARPARSAYSHLTPLCKSPRRALAEGLSVKRLATCLRCRAPLTDGNAQATDPKVCLSCLDAPTAPASRVWLYGLGAAGLAPGLGATVLRLGLAFAVSVLTRSPNVPRQGEVAEAVAEPADVPRPLPGPTDEPAPPSSDGDPADEEDPIT